MLFQPLRGFKLLAAVLIAVAAWPLGALVVPEGSEPIQEKAFRHADLYIYNRDMALTDLPTSLRQTAGDDLASLGLVAEAGRLDYRSNRWGTLLPSVPFIPGTGNDLQWAAAPADKNDLEAQTWNALVNYLRDNATALRIDLDEIANPGNVQSFDGSDLVQIHVPRLVGGVLVRDSFLTAIVNHGNLVLFGARTWGDVNTPAIPTLSEAQAELAVEAHVAPYNVQGYNRSDLVFVPVSVSADPLESPLGEGYAYRLVWVINPRFDTSIHGFGNWEALVDAHSGEILAFQDTNQYVLSTRRVEGGVLPVTNDGIAPDGIEHPDWPMPYTNVVNGGNTLFTDAGGNLLQCVDGQITTTLSGLYMRMNDNCGAINESTFGNVIDLGVSAGTDCAVPPGASPGNTHASRSGFYEMNRIIAMAKAYLPDNAWLQQQLTSNMNINSTCNAFWGGGTVNFYRSGGGCFNTGEIAAVYDHEWGHGMDNNGVNPNIANPGEGIPDVYASLRLNTSCIGRHFRATNCGGYGDPCLMCTGVRDIDWAKRASNTPHDVTWINANCGTGPAPCGGSVHCEGSVYSESIWDLWNRDLPTIDGMSINTARELVTKLSFLGANPVGTWFTCNQGTGGCNADGGYLNFLAVDDDNGNLMDGTPHMMAIHSAFNRHGIACNTPTVQDSGCAGAPTTAPTVTLTPQDRGAIVSWTPVAGASSYKVFRTDGVFACQFGKELVAHTTETSFVDTGLKNQRQYYYIVVPVGVTHTCFGPASSCTSVTPTGGPNLSQVAGSDTFDIVTGDSDCFLDNCESIDVWFNINNIGNAALTNLRVIDVVSPSHPDTVVVGPLPIHITSSLATCGDAMVHVRVQPRGLVSNDVLELEFIVTSDELAPGTKTFRTEIASVENDLQAVASQTWSFESNLEGWEVLEGTFVRQNGPPGAPPPAGSFYMASSNNLGNQCDAIQSPPVVLTPTSTLSLSNNFNIEPFCPTCTPPQWYDRANVALFTVASGERDAVSPDSGRLYNASGIGGTCGTTGQPGWADAMPTWAASGWSSTALGTANLDACEAVRLDIRYGTDPLGHGFGFLFDQVTLTNFSVLVADSGTDDCVGGPIFADSFETGDLSRWSSTVDP